MPAASTDSLKLLAAGRADLAVVDIHDLALARERGQDLVGVGALVQRPLAAVIARGDVRRPRDLAGKRVGVTGLPSDDAVLRAVLEHDGASLDDVRRVTIGFSAVPSLIAGRVDAVVAFWNAEGVALRRRGVDTTEFRVDRYGAPRYPELVVATTRSDARARRAASSGTRSPRCATAHARRCRTRPPRWPRWSGPRARTRRSCARSSTRSHPRSGRRCGWTRRRWRPGRASTCASGSSSRPPDLRQRLRHALGEQGLDERHRSRAPCASAAPRGPRRPPPPFGARPPPRASRRRAWGARRSEPPPAARRRPPSGPPPAGPRGRPEPPPRGPRPRERRGASSRTAGRGR